MMNNDKNIENNSGTNITNENNAKKNAHIFYHEKIAMLFAIVIIITDSENSTSTTQRPSNKPGVPPDKGQR